MRGKITHACAITVLSCVAFEANAVACSVSDLNLFHQQEYSARAASHQKVAQTAEAALIAAQSNLQESGPERGSDYNSAEYFMAKQQHLASKAFNQSTVSENSDKLSCHQRLAAEFKELGRYQGLIEKQFQKRFATELDRASLVFEWRNALSNRAEVIRKQSGTDLDRFVAAQFPALYMNMAKLGAPAEYSDIGRYSLLIDHQYGLGFKNATELKKLTRDWDQRFLTKIQALQGSGSGDLIALYQDLSKKVSYAQSKAVVRDSTF